MPYLRELLIAVYMLALCTWHVRHAARTSTRLSVGLAVVSCAFFGYFLMNVYQVELALGTVVAAGSSLVKNLLLAVAAMGCVVVWKIAGVPLWQRWGGHAVAAGYSITATVVWWQLRRQCPESEGIKYDLCALGTPAGANTEIAGLLLVSAAAAYTEWLLRSQLGWRTRGQRAALMLVSAIAASVAWCVVAAIGVWQVWQHGELSAWQYAVRPVLSVVAAALLVGAAMYLPTSGAIRALCFYFDARPVLRALDVRFRDIMRAPSDMVVSDTMDAIGDRLGESEIPIRQRRRMPAAAEISAAAHALVGTSAPRAVAVPAVARPEAQREWIIQMARVIDREEKMVGPGD